MKTISFEIKIKASVEKVYNSMLGIKDKSTYQQWTSVFNELSTFEGNWEEGSKMLFLGISQEGKRGGMVSEIVKNSPNKFVSLRHYGIVDGDQEITNGPEVEEWAGSLENYIFSEIDDKTKVVVELDVTEQYLDYFNEKWPKALAKLKKIVEN